MVYIYKHNEINNLIKISPNILDFLLKILIQTFIGVATSHVKVSYQFNKLPAISPDSLGAGTSYVAKILIVCLLAKKGNILLIENPEIHLHPKAQAKLGEFFAFIANNGVQVVLETHCENLINQVRYEVYKNIEMDGTGHFIRENKEDRNNFPTGFFNSTLKELLEMG